MACMPVSALKYFVSIMINECWFILKNNYLYDFHTVCDILMKQDSRSPEQNRSLYPPPLPPPINRVQSLYS